MSRQEETRAIALTVARQHGREIPGVSDWAEAQDLYKQFEAMDAARAVRDAEPAPDAKWPEHQKMHEAQKEAIILGEFLENLGNMGLMLVDSEGDGFGRLLGTRRNIQDIIAQHLCIDLKKIEQEKQEMLEQVRRGNEQEREMNQ